MMEIDQKREGGAGTVSQMNRRNKKIILGRERFSNWQKGLLTQKVQKERSVILK